jgi:PAS domain S-box-containing protein
VGEIGLALGRDAGARPALEAAARALARPPGISLACLFTVEGDGNFLELAAAAGPGERPCELGARLLIGHDRYGRAVQQRRAAVARDESGWFLACPVRVGEDVLGLATLASAEVLSPAFAGEVESAAALLGQFLDRTRLQAELRTSEGLLGLVTDQLPSILWTLDGHLRFTASLGSGLRALGLRPGQMVGRTLFDWLGPNPEANPSLGHHLRALAGEIVTYEWKEQGVSFETRLQSLRDAEGRITGVVGFSADVSQRERERQALQASEHQYRLVVENANEAIVVAQDGRLRFVNGKAEEIIGYSRAELLGMPLLEAVHPDDHGLVMDRYQRRIQGENVPHFYSFRVVRPDGGVRWVDINAITFEWEGRPATLNFFTDVTERERAQEALRARELEQEREQRRVEEALHRAQKMQSLGLLAGGIAHDFNNLLVAILGHAELAAREVPPNSALGARIAQMALAARRAAELTHQMLVFAGKGRVTEQAVELSALVGEISELLAAALAKQTRLDYGLAPDLPALRGDPSQLRQLVMNLLTNASEALEGRAGAVRVRTGCLDADKATLVECVLGEDLAPGRYVFLEVEDEGSGMTAETQARMFDPFFTTKFAGRGLGLAATLGIVRGHRGAIRVRSQPGRGTTFGVLFPVAAPVEARNPATVLALDADAGVLAALKAWLTDAGFHVLTARSGGDGLTLLEGAGPELVLALVDDSVTRDRPEIAGELRQRRPALPILFSTGYAEAEARQREDATARDAFIQKPYRHAALVEAAQRARDLAG